MPQMIQHRANAGTVIVNGYLYAFGGFQTVDGYGQVGLDSLERLNISDPKAHWQMVDLVEGSIDLGKMACFYLSDITGFLKANALKEDDTVVRD